MQLANLTTQSLSVELKPEDRELLTKAADLAILKLAGDNKFNDKSVQISIVDDVLKVRRLRPNKIVFSAKKDENGEWKSIGVPNIDPLKDLKILGELGEIKVEIDRNNSGERDASDTLDVNDRENVEILENIAKLEDEVIQIERSSKQPPRKSRRRSNELG